MHDFFAHKKNGTESVDDNGLQTSRPLQKLDDVLSSWHVTCVEDYMLKR